MIRAGLTKAEAEALSHDEMLVLTAEIEYENQVRTKAKVLNDPPPPFVDGDDWKQHIEGVKREIEALDIEHYADY